LDAETIGAYDAAARHYADHRSVRDASRAHRFAASTPVGPRLDLGCGPGLYFGLLGVPLVGCDASTAMLDVARSVEPSVVLVRADQEALPFARRSFAGVWANKCLQHVAAPDLPMVLADLHRILRVDGRLGAELFAGEGELRSDDDLPGRRFVLWDPEELRDLLAGAGFAVGRLEVTDRGDDLRRLLVEATRLRTLPDTVGPDMRLLVCGLNPSLVAADAGVGFAGPTNRFWKALRLAGLSEVDRDARLLLQRDGIGMTDQVKRATRAASELRAADYRSGVARLERLVARTQPAALCVVGLAGWRAAVDRSARPGWQPDTGWAAPVYVMPSTSGLNAGTSLDELATHLAAAARGR
jgi:TDG/mug DNA glycosylase family protein